MTNDLTQSSSNHRRSDRKSPSGIVHVTDAMTGERMGQIGNLSAEGLMLIAQNHIEQGALFQMEFTLTDLNNQDHCFNVGALCLWCSAASTRSAYWAGFEIMDISEHEEAIFRDIVVHL